jgi:hypothetical protein
MCSGPRARGSLVSIWTIAPPNVTSAKFVGHEFRHFGKSSRSWPAVVLPHIRSFSTVGLAMGLATVGGSDSSSAMWETPPRRLRPILAHEEEEEDSRDLSPPSSPSSSRGSSSWGSPTPASPGETSICEGDDDGGEPLPQLLSPQLGSSSQQYHDPTPNNSSSSSRRTPFPWMCVFDLDVLEDVFTGGACCATTKTTAMVDTTSTRSSEWQATAGLGPFVSEWFLPPQQHHHQQHVDQTTTRALASSRPGEPTDRGLCTRSSRRRPRPSSLRGPSPLQDSLFYDYATDASVEMIAWVCFCLGFRSFRFVRSIGLHLGHTHAYLYSLPFFVFVRKTTSVLTSIVPSVCSTTYTTSRTRPKQPTRVAAPQRLTSR